MLEIGVLELSVIIAFCTNALTYLIVNARIFDKPRQYALTNSPDWLKYLLTCPLCLAFHLCAYLTAGLWIIDKITFTTFLLSWFASSSMSHVIWRFSELLAIGADAGNEYVDQKVIEARQLLEIEEHTFNHDTCDTEDNDEGPRISTR